VHVPSVSALLYSGPADVMARRLPIFASLVCALDDEPGDVPEVEDDANIDQQRGGERA
jgi:hypothetical protein